MTLVVVEDAPKTGAYLKQSLAEAGFNTDLACDGVDGTHLALAEFCDLMVLDIMRPGIDGWHVLQATRRSGRDLPELILTAQGLPGRPSDRAMLPALNEPMPLL